MIQKSGLDAYNAEAEQIRRAINSMPLDKLIPLKKSKHGGGYICPICGSGSKVNATGALYIKNNRVTCFANGCFGGDGKQGTDTLGALRILWPELKEREIFERCGMPMTGNYKQDRNEHNTQYTIHNTEHTTQDHVEKEADYIAFFLKANKDLTGTSYHRGISLDTLNRFTVGYVEKWRHPKVGDKVPFSPRLIIPTSRSSYIARDTRTDIPDAQKGYAKSKVGHVHIFNLKAVEKAQKPLFIVEGELDALSIIDVGGEAVGLGSTSMIGGLLSFMKTHKPARPVIIALDNDAAGQKGTEALEAGLQEHEIPYYRMDITGSCKDANDALQADRDAFKAAVDKAIAEVEQAEQEKLEAIRAEYRKTSTLNFLQGFLDGIADSVNTPAISTGFPRLDSILDGGLYEGLHIIGGISSLGKTSLCLQIADNIAAAGEDVLIISLEMARAELMAKSISRLTAVNALHQKLLLGNAKTARGITCADRYLKYSDTEQRLIQQSIESYKDIAGNLFIHEGIGNIGTEEIRELVKKHISITGRKPVVLVDYMQILAPADVRMTDKQAMDKNVLELKRIARDFKIPIMAVSSLNRESYKSKISMSAFKESGAIEYGSDVLIGLQLEGAGKDGFDADEAKAKNPRQIELHILKNRNSETGKQVKLEYYPAFNYFVERKTGGADFGGVVVENGEMWVPIDE